MATFYTHEFDKFKWNVANLMLSSMITLYHQQ